MGSGASKKASKQAQKKAASAAEDLALPPAQRRLRRIFFGQELPHKFEYLPLHKQYTELTIFEDDNPVFTRLADEEVHALRRDAQQQNAETAMQDVEGYLEPQAVELLGLGLGPGSSLSRRLFEVAQVTSVYRAPPIALEPTAASPAVLPEPQKEKRKGKLTCYELLALYSILHAGVPSELAELLFSIFDVDGDDLVSAGDFEASVDLFAEIQGALQGEDAEDFSRLDGKTKRDDAKALAEEVVRYYGAGNAGEMPLQPIPGAGVGLATRGPVDSSDSEAETLPKGLAHDRVPLLKSSATAELKADLARHQEDIKDKLERLKDAADEKSAAGKGGRGCCGPRRPGSPKKKNKDRKQKAGCLSVCGRKPKQPKAPPIGPLPKLTFEQWREWFKVTVDLPDDPPAAATAPPTASVESSRLPYGVGETSQAGPAPARAAPRPPIETVVQMEPGPIMEPGPLVRDRRQKQLDDLSDDSSNDSVTAVREIGM